MPGPVWLILPTYDEAASLAGVVARARAALAGEDLHILVVDDASPDGTGALAERLGAEVLHRPRKLGLGSAYVAGFARALAGGAELVCQLDADGSHDPAALPGHARARPRRRRPRARLALRAGRRRRRLAPGAARGLARRLPVRAQPSCACRCATSPAA